MIQRITDKKHIPEILELAKRITVCDFSLKELQVFLETQISNPAVFIMLDSKHCCFAICSVYRDLVVPYINIMYAYSDPKYPQVTGEEMRMLKDWAKSLGISVIKATVRKNIRAFARKYNFKFDGVLLKMEV